MTWEVEKPRVMIPPRKKTPKKKNQLLHWKVQPKGIYGTLKQTNLVKKHTIPSGTIEENSIRRAP